MHALSSPAAGTASARPRPPRSTRARRSHAVAGLAPRHHASGAPSGARHPAVVLDPAAPPPAPSPPASPPTSRRAAVASVALAPLALAPCPPPPPALADTECTECSNSNSSLAPGDVPFTQSPSGARFADLRVGDGPSPRPGQTVVVEWVGYTAGYQAKKIESTRETDTPFVFVVGEGRAIPAFEEAVLEMKQGGIRRIEIPGELEEKLAYSRDPAMRYAVGPEPTTFAGKRALDFVLDNRTLKDFNRTLLFDIRLSNIRK